MPAETLECPNCAAPLSIPPGRTQFFCHFCGATVVVPEELRGESPDRWSGDSATGGYRDEEEPLEPTPDLSRFTIEKDRDRLMVSWSWRSPVSFFLLPFGLIFFGFSVFWTVMATAMAGPFGLFGVPFMVVGAGLMYFAVASLVNHSTVKVEDGRLTVEHGPMPWKSPEPMEVDDIQQLYVEERVHRGKNGPNYTYEVQVLTHQGGKRKLVTEYKPEDARAIERMIEVHLGLQDRTVRGEHAR